MVIGGQNHPPAALIPVKDTGAYITGRWVGPRADLRKECIFPPPGFEHWNVHPVASRYTGYSIPAPGSVWEKNVSFHHLGSDTETSTPLRVAIRATLSRPKGRSEKRMYLSTTWVRTLKRPPRCESLYGLLYPEPLYGCLYSTMLSVRHYNAVFTVDDWAINFFFLAVEILQICTIQRNAVSVSSTFLRRRLFCRDPSQPLLCKLSVQFALTLTTPRFVGARTHTHTPHARTHARTHARRPARPHTRTSYLRVSSDSQNKQQF